MYFVAYNDIKFKHSSNPLRYSSLYQLHTSVVLKLFSLRRLWKTFLDLRRTRNKMLINTHIIKVFYLWLLKTRKNNPDILFDLYVCSNKCKALRTFRHVCYIFFPHRPAARFQDLVGHYTFLGGQDPCFYYMFKSNFSGRNKIWRGTKEIWRGTAPECAPVATGLLPQR